jgi:hypothetical protein
MCAYFRDPSRKKLTDVRGYTELKRSEEKLIQDVQQLQNLLQQQSDESQQKYKSLQSKFNRAKVWRLPFFYLI